MTTFTEAVPHADLRHIQKPGVVDAIVVGAGATGGLAADRLTQAGLRVLMLDAGVPPRDEPWWRDAVRRLQPQSMRKAAVERRRRRRQPIQSQCYAWEHAPDAFVDDIDCPYSTPPDRAFVWLRSRQLGGRMRIPGHGRQYYRLSHADFDPSDGLSEPWPFAAAEIDPWYSLIEQHLALSGRREGNPSVPDSDLASEVVPTVNEAQFIDAVTERWPHAWPILGRFGAPPTFLERAFRSGRLIVRRGAVARELHVDGAGRIEAVTWVDTESRSEARASAPLVFLCASALESTRLLMLSRSARRPGGLGSASGVLGRHLMDHIRFRLTGHGAPLLSVESPEAGRCVYLPRFDARSERYKHGRGFGVQVYRSSGPGDVSSFGAAAFGEMLPSPQNRVVLDDSRRDAWGIPVLHIDCAHTSADRQRGQDQIRALHELAAALGVKPVRAEGPAAPGTANHECGTARMGRDPASSVLNPHNECWDASGLYVTDGACFPSQGTQNPTLTLLALTARACAHAVGMTLPDTAPPAGVAVEAGG